MKKILALILILGTQLVHAISVEDQIRFLARKVNFASQSAERLTMDEKLQVLKALNNADRLLARVTEDNGRYPAPPMPSEPRYPRDPRPSPVPFPSVTCDRDSTTLYQQTFSKIKQIAYASTGLDYTSDQSVAYAQEWSRRFPCSYADRFMTDLTRVKKFAYASTGLNYTSSDAVAFALVNTEKLCSNYNLEGEFSQAYNFAYSSSGLNMTSFDAARYALDRVKFNAFSCRNP